MMKKTTQDAKFGQEVRKKLIIDKERAHKARIGLAKAFLSNVRETVMRRFPFWYVLTLPGNLFCQVSIIWKRRLLLSKTTTQECKKSPFVWRVSLKNAFASCMVYFTWPEETNKNSMYKLKWRAPHSTPSSAIISSWNEWSQSWMRDDSPDEHKQ